MVFFDFTVLIISIAALVIGAELLVKSASKIAKHFGVSDFVIGLTLVAIGTSLPELAAAISASFAKDSGLIMGNVIGSNIANIGLVLGLAALLYTIETKDSIFRKDSAFLFWITILFIIFALNKVISPLEGSIFILIFILYMFSLFKAKPEAKIIGVHKYIKPHKHLGGDFIKYSIFSILGLLGLYFGAKFLIPSAENIAFFYNIPTELIGLTLIAIGTSLPELAVTIIAARKHMEGIFVGNLIGSSIANILLILGVSSLINRIEISNIILFFMAPIMFVLTIMLLRFIRINWAHRILQGFALLFVYLIFIIILIFFRF